MTKGERKDGAGLYTDQTLRELTVTLDGKEYVFKWRKIPYFAKMDIIGECADADRRTVKLGLYYRRMLAKMIVEHQFDEPLEIALVKLSDETAAQLKKIVPSIAELTAEQEDFTGEPSEAPPR